MIRLVPSVARRQGLIIFACLTGFSILIAACGGSDADSSTGGDSTTAPPETAGASAELQAETGTTTDEPSTVGEPTAEPDVEPVVYNDDFATSIQPIFADRCASCHSPGGPGTAHWELDEAADLVADHEDIAKVVASQYMPPWPAGGDSVAFLEDRSLRPDQIQAILDWSDAGAPLDVPPENPIEPVNGLARLADPDLVIAPAQSYAGSSTKVDDYRCQIYDPQLPDGGWITGYEFVPDQTEVVHHAIGYLLPASARDEATGRDGEDGRPGWQCYGSSGLGADDIFLGWAPGQNPSEMPDGTGLYVEPGAFIVVQIHYHYESEAPADSSVLAVTLADDTGTTASGTDLEAVVVSEYAAPAEIPCATGEQGPLCDREAALADAVARFGREGVLADDLLRVCGATVEDFAGMTDGQASSSCDLPVGLIGGTGEIISILGHEHEIGDWLKITLNPDRDDEQVLLDIPDWDFNWQYNYAPRDQIVLDGDDVIRLECGWDRSRRSTELEPAYVLWADGTNDEMCFATITTRPAN